MIFTLAMVSLFSPQDYLIQLSETGYGALSAAGPTSAATALPKAVQRVLKSRACRTAVMFGDEIGEEDAAELIRCVCVFGDEIGEEDASELIRCDCVCLCARSG